MYGRAGIRSDASNRTAMAPMGSTTPLRDPNTNDLHRLLPAARIGIEIMAPSGMFCMAMPNDTEMAAAKDMCEHHANGHAFGQVVYGYGKGKHGGL